MYKVNEVFLSLQGEGPMVGAPAVFVRFAGCNLACPFCDTQHETFNEMNQNTLLDAIDNEIADIGSERDGFPVVLTGGEPLLQMDDDLVDLLHDRNFQVHVETNAMEDTYLRAKKAPFEYLGKCDEVVASPKGYEWSTAIVELATALKVVVPLPSGLDMEDLADMARLVRSNRLEEVPPSLFLQPVTPGGGGVPDWDERFQANCKEARDRAFDLWGRHQQRWRVLPQTHVWMGIQ